MKVEVRDSPVHGKGVFATERIEKGERIGEYTGRRIKQPRVPVDRFHTFYFFLSNGLTISPHWGGNELRYVNHCCEPNVDVDEVRGRIYFRALKVLKPGQELFIRYNLTNGDPVTAKMRREYACHCGAKKCTGTMLDTETE